MLETDTSDFSAQFPRKLERYLGELLHGQVDIRPSKAATSIPTFIERTYLLLEAQILGRPCIIMARFDGEGTPADIAKHVGIVRNATGSIAAFATETLSAYNRARLIGQGVPFVVPGNQLYLPDLAIDLREHFRAPRQHRTEGISPAAQTVLFHHILYPDQAMPTPSLLAERLHYSAMSIGRAFDDLVAAGFADTVREGRERHIRFKASGRELLTEVTPYLRTPVRTVKFVRGKASTTSFKLAGESALSRLTELGHPRIDTFAVPATDWMAISQALGLVETGQDEAGYRIETWSYDPAALSDTDTVDPLSLYAQFHDHRDERIAMAAEQLLETLPC